MRFTASGQLRQCQVGSLSWKKCIDLVDYHDHWKGFVNTIWPSNKIVKHSTPMPPLASNAVLENSESGHSSTRAKAKVCDLCRAHFGVLMFIS